MSALIDDLLALSRISRIQNPFEDVDVNGLIEIVKKRIEVDIKEYRVDFCVAQNIPIVKCDRIKMTEVFLNLISNAIKFSSKNIQNNKGAPKVVVGYSDEGDLHKFFVKDNGIGIDPQYYDQIFGIFKRLHSSEEYEGTGAGLSIVKRVIDDHGGKVWVESQVGEGTTFCFTIPKDLKKKKKIGEILVEEGAISENQLAEGLKKQGGGDDVPGYQGEATNV